MVSDWTIIGGGLTGASLAYELTKRGQSVTLIERHQTLQGATRWSYGGVAYWSGTTPISRQWCQESHDRYHQLPQELGQAIQYRETGLLVTIAPDLDPDQVYQDHQHFGFSPERLSAQDAKTLEPLLNDRAIQGALRFPHGHVNPVALTEAYTQRFQALGGQRLHTTVQALQRRGDRLVSLTTDQGELACGHVILAAGGMGRSLLNALGVKVPLFFTQAEMIETSPTDQRLNHVILPAQQSRLRLEALLRDPALDHHWTQLDPRHPSPDPLQDLAPPVLEPGTVQFPDGHIRFGQISRLCPQLYPRGAEQESETIMRGAIAQILPDLGNLPGTWHRCNVSFSVDGLPLIGPVNPLDNLHLFSGFTSPFALVPALSVRFAQGLTDSWDPSLNALHPQRVR